MKKKLMRIIYCIDIKDSGSNMEKRWTGLKNLGLLSLGTGNLDLSFNGWHHKVQTSSDGLHYLLRSILVAII